MRMTQEAPSRPGCGRTRHLNTRGVVSQQRVLTELQDSSGRIRRFLSWITLCGLVTVGLNSIAAAQNQDVSVKPLKPLPSVQLLDFTAALRSTPGGDAYLREPLEDPTGATRQRIALWRERLAVPDGTFLELVKDDRRQPEMRALGLRMLADDHSGLDRELLAELLASDHQTLRLETIRTLQDWKNEHAREFLRTIAADIDNPPLLRAEAIVGLAPYAAGDKPTRTLLLRLANGQNAILRSESLRSLRGLAASHPDVRATITALAAKVNDCNSPFSHNDLELVEQIVLAYGKDNRKQIPSRLLTAARDARPTDADDWYSKMKEGGDPAAGRRVFFHAKAAHCSQCHTIDGRGGLIASDLSNVGRATGRKLLVESIIEPSKKIPRPYVTWTVVTDRGKVYSGLIRDNLNQNIELMTAENTLIEIPHSRIDHRSPQKVSLMPKDLVDRMTTAEFRNLIAYLRSRR